MESFEDLLVWQECRTLRKEITILASHFPPKEKFLLYSQIIRAVRSITANVAEGFGRFSFQENAQYCRIARGSCFEVQDHLILALDENYLTTEEFNRIKLQLDSCKRLLNGYINYLIKQKSKSIKNQYPSTNNH